MKKLNFGCGADIKAGWDNVDVQENEKLTKSFDFNEFPYPIKNDTYDYVYLKDVLEHLDEPDKVIEELKRISKKDAIIEIIVPHYQNKGAYSDLQHKHYFNDVAFEMLVEQKNAINKTKKFEIVELNLTPTSVGRFFPSVIRKNLSLFFRGLISQIHIKLRVIK